VDRPGIVVNTLTQPFFCIADGDVYPVATTTGALAEAACVVGGRAADCDASPSPFSGPSPGNGSAGPTGMLPAISASQITEEAELCLRFTARCSLSDEKV